MEENNKNKLLEKAIAFYEKTFANTANAKQYLTDKLINDAGLYTKHRIGLANGNLLKALPKNGKVIEDLMELGILKNGKEYFINHIIFPVTDSENNIKNIVGINIKSGEEIYLFQDAETILNIPVTNTYDEVYQTKNIIDLLSIEQAGINNVISGYEDIGNNNIAVRKIDENINEILINNGTEAVENYLSSLNNVPSNDVESCNEVARSTSTRIKQNPDKIERTREGFTIQYGLKKYQIIGLEKAKRKLKATIRIEKAGRIHIETIDFYSSKMRRQLQQDICSNLEELPETIQHDLNKLLKLCEHEIIFKHSNDENTKENHLNNEISTEDKEEAIAFGKSKNLIKLILADYEKCGYVGKSENANKLLCYLAATSRLMGEGKTLSVIILSSSGAGKSKLQDITLNFINPESVEKLTNLTGKALFYKERESLKYKILALEESNATNEEANYAIRSLISSGQLISEVTVRDANTGRMTTQQNILEAGCTVVFYTSTNPEQNAETASRFFTIGVDESDQLTKSINEFTMNQFSLDGLTKNEEIENIKRKHRNFQRLLKKYKVVNPYIIKFNDNRLQARRLFPQMLNLINTVAFLKQMQKKIKTHNKINYIEVEKIDIDIALKLAKNILGKSINELSIPAHDLLKQIDEYLEKQKKKLIKQNADIAISKSNITFTRKEIRLEIGWKNTRLHLYLKELINHEYVILESGKRNTLQHYKLMYDANGKFTWLNNIENMIKIEKLE